MNIIIAGNGKVGFALAQQLSAEKHDITLIDSNRDVLNIGTEQFDVMAELLEKDGIRATLIEKDYRRCQALANALRNTSVIHGDVSQQSVLEDEGIDSCDALVTLTGMEMVGPTCNYAIFSPLSKIVLIIDMLAGRLEIFPLLVLLTRSTWKHQ